MTLRTAHLTHPGRKRRHNEDSYVHEPPLFAIADGMGGAKAGEVASGLAVDALQLRTDVGGDGEAYVVDLIQEANRRVYDRANEDSEASGMGTTMTVALVDDENGRVTFGHVGDSRAYRVRGGELEQLTDDHSLVGELVRSGRLSPEEAESHPQRSVITRALGTEPDVDVDTFTVEAHPGDVYLLCSDGLTDMTSARDILAAVEQSRDLDDAARSLVQAANAGGGEDNITVVLFEIAGDQHADDLGETAQLPAAVEDDDDDDEDTLSPLDAVPAVDTAVIPAAVVEERLQQVEAEVPSRPEPRRRILPLVLLIVLLVGLIALALWGLTR
jgi:PPM family protein phosphatase